MKAGRGAGDAEASPARGDGPRRFSKILNGVKVCWLEILCSLSLCNGKRSDPTCFLFVAEGFLIPVQFRLMA